MYRLSKKSLAAITVAASAGVVALTGAAAAASTDPADPPAETVADTTAVAAPTTAPPSDSADPPAAAPGTITVSGTGSVTVDPDTAVVNLGVQANAPTGAAAMDQVSTGVADLTAALVAAGIAEEDIQTSGLNLWPTTGDDGVTVTGYQASINVNVTVRDITAVGSTVDTAQAAAGPGFTVGGVTFSFADPESVLEAARVEAFENAKAVAEQYAAAAGLTLGPVESIVDTPLGVPVNYGSVVAREDTAQAAVPVSPGTLDLQVQVTVTFSTS